jgi:ComF family protein
MIHGLKYEGRTWLAPVMVSSMATRLAVAGFCKLETLVVPVPLHRARMRERGYNQSDLLAKGLGQALGFPVGAALTRVRVTKTQTRLGLEDRNANVAGAFAVRKGICLDGKRILLVDDVVTTSASQRNLCKPSLT